jgi:hypothetical protein
MHEVGALLLDLRDRNLLLYCILRSAPGWVLVLLAARLEWHTDWHSWLPGMIGAVLGVYLAERRLGPAFPPGLSLEDKQRIRQLVRGSAGDIGIDDAEHVQYHAIFVHRQYSPALAWSRIAICYAVLAVGGSLFITQLLNSHETAAAIYWAVLLAACVPATIMTRRWTKCTLRAARTATEQASRTLHGTNRVVAPPRRPRRPVSISWPD